MTRSPYSITVGLGLFPKLNNSKYIQNYIWQLIFICHGKYATNGGILEIKKLRLLGPQFLNRKDEL